MHKLYTTAICLFCLISCKRESVSGKLKIDDDRVVVWTKTGVTVYQGNRKLAAVYTFVNLYSVNTFANERPINEVTVEKWQADPAVTYVYKSVVGGKVRQVMYEHGSIEPTSILEVDSAGQTPEEKALNQQD